MWLLARESEVWRESSASNRYFAREFCFASSEFISQKVEKTVSQDPKTGLQKSNSQTQLERTSLLSLFQFVLKVIASASGSVEQIQSMYICKAVTVAIL